MRETRNIEIRKIGFIIEKSISLTGKILKVGYALLNKV